MSNTKLKGSFGEPLSRSVGSSWTRRELQALKRAGRCNSVSQVIRSLIQPEKLEQLILETEAMAKAKGWD